MRISFVPQVISSARFSPRLGAAIGLALFALIVTAAKGIATVDVPRRNILSVAEKRIVKDPFPRQAAQVRILKELEGELSSLRLSKLLPASPRSMGWNQPDEEYWNNIPPEARNIPGDWSRLPVVRFTSSELGGNREIRFASGRLYDLWLLRDPLHDLTAFISVHKGTHRVYFGELSSNPGRRWTAAPTFDPCYSCHPSGPRVIRPVSSEGVDRKTLAEFNSRILRYRACDFGNSISEKERGQENGTQACSICHNGTNRGRLYSIHRRTIRFKTEIEGAMPPSD